MEKVEVNTMFGREIRRGDRIKVRYTTGERFKGGTIQGPVTELWDAQLQVKSGWCCHPKDELLEYAPAE